MNTLADFDAMDHADKAELTWTGTYLGERSEGEQTVQLYSLTGFYVEVFYDRTRNEITRFRGFKHLRLLAPYIRL